MLFHLRLGNRESFSNIPKAQCHTVATAAMNKSHSSVHENVKGYDDEMLHTSCPHKMMMAELLDMHV